jgi:hypothetical protein
MKNLGEGRPEEIDRLVDFCLFLGHLAQSSAVFRVLDWGCQHLVGPHHPRLASRIVLVASSPKPAHPRDDKGRDSSLDGSDNIFGLGTHRVGDQDNRVNPPTETMRQLVEGAYAYQDQTLVIPCHLLWRWGTGLDRDRVQR